MPWPWPSAPPSPTRYFLFPTTCPPKLAPPTLPQAPNDLRLNQRLAALHTRAERFAEAWVCCRTLQSVYSEAGYPEEATRYGELADRYEQRSSVSAASDSAIELPTLPEETSSERSRSRSRYPLPGLLLLLLSLRKNSNSSKHRFVSVGGTTYCWQASSENIADFRLPIDICHNVNDNRQSAIVECRSNDHRSGHERRGR